MMGECSLTLTQVGWSGPHLEGGGHLGGEGLGLVGVSRVPGLGEVPPGGDDSVVLPVVRHLDPVL